MIILNRIIKILKANLKRGRNTTDYNELLRPKALGGENVLIAFIVLMAIGTSMNFFLDRDNSKDNKNISSSSITFSSENKVSSSSEKNYVLKNTIQQMKETVVVDSTEIIKTEADKFRKKGKYMAALERYSKLIDLKKDDNLLRMRSICFEKIGNHEKAVFDLKNIRNLNSEDEKRYNKLNPIRRRVVGRCTLCCDGTYSPSCAKGCGACSWHGGVCQWNAPIYEEDRKW